VGDRIVGLGDELEDLVLEPVEERCELIVVHIPIR
jgi:hypothetical protein